MPNDNDRDGVVSTRLPGDEIDALEQLAEETGHTQANLQRIGIRRLLETHRDLLEDATELERLSEERDEIVKEGREVDRILGFPGRVENRLETLFQDKWEAEKLRDSMKSYYRDAENLEQQAEAHRDIESVEPGEFIEAVDRALEETIEAVHLSEWEEEYDNRLEKFEGVATGKQAERQTLALTRTMMQRDEDLEALRSLSDTNPRVGSGHAPDAARDEDLPEGVTVEAVADAARRLVDEDVDPEALPLDPVEFRRQAPDEVADLLGEDPGEETVRALEQDGGVDTVESGAVTIAAETDGGSERAVASDGGDHVAVQTFDEDPDEVVVEQGADDDRPDDLDDSRDMNDLVEETAEKLREAESYSSDAHTDKYVEKKREKRRRTAEDRIRTAFESDTDNWRDNLMADTDLTPDDLIDLADEYNEQRAAALRGERDGVPDAVVEENGGVNLE